MTETTFENYQERAERTLVDLGSIAINGSHMALGVASEMGELTEGMYVGDEVNVAEEAGDLNWYIANECNIYGFVFEDMCEIARQSYEDGRLESFKLHDLVDLHKKELAYGKAMDKFELFSQLVGLIYKIIGISKLFNFKYEDTLKKNIDKLYQRYPEKFTQESALNRDLNKERKILE